MKKKFTYLKVFLSLVFFTMASISHAQNDGIAIRNNVGNLPAYNPQAPVVGNANVVITSDLGRDIPVTYKNATSFDDGSNKYVILGAAAFGTGSIEFKAPAGLGTLTYSIETKTSKEPVVYINGVKTTMVTDVATTLNLKGVVTIKFANESANPAEGVIVKSLKWTDYDTADQISTINNAGALPAYNPQAPVVGDDNVTIKSDMGRDIAAAYKKATAYNDGTNTYVILGAAYFGTGSITFSVPAGLGTLRYSIDTDTSIEPVVYINGVKTSMKTDQETTLDLTGAVTIKFANESADPAKAVIVKRIKWTDYASDQIATIDNAGKLPAYNPQAPVVGDDNVIIQSNLGRDVAVSYTKATAFFDGSNTYVILGAAVFGSGTIQFKAPAGLGSLRYSIDTDTSIEPVVYINGVKTSMTTDTDLQLNMTGVVTIKFANESADPAKAVIVKRIKWTDFKGFPTGVSEMNNFKAEVYPNPTNGKLYINFGQELSNARLIIYNVNGTVVENKILSGSRITYDLSKNRTGIYFVKVISGEKSFVNKVILTK